MKRDSQVFDLISEERNRQMHGIELIASENFVSDEVMEAMGSVLTNKYAEGYPAARYYGGCQVVDKVENLAIERVCKLYGAEYANVQPHSGAQANMAVFFAVLKPGDTFMGLDLAHGSFVGLVSFFRTRFTRSYAFAFHLLFAFVLAVPMLTPLFYSIIAHSIHLRKCTICTYAMVNLCAFRILNVLVQWYIIKTQQGKHDRKARGEGCTGSAVSRERMLRQ